MTFTNTDLKLLNEIIKLDDKYPENCRLHVFVVEEAKSIIEYYKCGYIHYDRLLHHVNTLYNELRSGTEFCRLKRDNNKLVKLKDILEAKMEGECSNGDIFSRL